MEYVHRLPGRLRVRSEALKRNPKRGSEVLTAVGMLPGVRDVHVNILTGSVLVQFDPARVSADEVSAELVRCGVTVAPRTAPVGAELDVQKPSIGGAFGKAIVTSVLQYAVERSVVQLLPMLL